MHWEEKVLGYERSNLLPVRWVGSGFLNTLLMIVWRENLEGLGLKLSNLVSF